MDIESGKALSTQVRLGLRMGIFIAGVIFKIIKPNTNNICVPNAINKFHAKLINVFFVRWKKSSIII